MPQFIFQFVATGMRRLLSCSLCGSNRHLAFRLFISGLVLSVWACTHKEMPSRRHGAKAKAKATARAQAKANASHASSGFTAELAEYQGRPAEEQSIIEHVARQFAETREVDYEFQLAPFLAAANRLFRERDGCFNPACAPHTTPQECDLPGCEGLAACPMPCCARPLCNECVFKSVVAKICQPDGKALYELKCPFCRGMSDVSTTTLKTLMRDLCPSHAKIFQNMYTGRDEVIVVHTACPNGCYKCPESQLLTRLL